MRPLCQKCNKCLASKAGNLKTHKKQYYKKLCTGCAHEKNHGKRHPFKKHHKYARPWLVHRKDICEECSFIPKHMCQLDVDHMDGNKKNNAPNNLRTLCANCHRLKTQEANEYHTRSYRGVA